MHGYKDVHIIPDREKVTGTPISLTPFHSKQTVCTAVLGRPFYDGSGLSSIRHHIVPLWWVLLDSGSDGDLLFLKAGSKSIPYDVQE